MQEKISRPHRINLTLLIYLSMDF